MMADDDDHRALEAVLVDIGVAFPFHGYAPGAYSVPCRRCARRHTADKRAYRCLPCALRDALDTGEDVQTAAYGTGFRAGLVEAKKAVERVNANAQMPGPNGAYVAPVLAGQRLGVPDLDRRS